MNKKIKVIIPVYNCEKYVEEAVLSVINQDCKNIEILIVDDGSVDRSGEICDTLEAKYENIAVLHKKNGGVASARNDGIEYFLNKDGDVENYYFAFLDADDKWVDNFWTPDILKILEKNYCLIGFLTARSNESLSRRRALKEIREGELAGGLENIWEFQSQDFFGMLYRADLIKKFNVRFQNLKYSEDKMFHMECMAVSSNIYLKNKLFTLYRQNKYSIMHNRGWGIPYYMPIINGYLYLEKRLKEVLCVSNLNLGTNMAGIYVKDMCIEHYQHFGKDKELNDLFADRKDLFLLFCKKFELDNNQYSNYKEAVLKNRKKFLKFRIKYSLQGIKIIIIQFLLSKILPQTLIDYLKYSVRI